MPLADQWRRIEEALPAGWAEAQLELAIADGAHADRAAALLGPFAPGRLGERIRFAAARRGPGPGPEAVRRLLGRLDEEGIDGRLSLLARTQAEEATPAPRASLVAGWEAALAALPADWSDLYCELELTSSDDLDPAALLLAPVNPAAIGDTPGFRFRVARSFGYGASPQMARRCLERLDADGVPGDLRILRVLSDTKPVETQGPVWVVDGKVV